MAVAGLTGHTSERAGLPAGWRPWHARARGPEGADSPIKGTDFAVVRDGRIQSITGFLDQVPPGA